MTEPQVLRILYGWLLRPVIVEVETAGLVPHVKAYVERWRRDRPATRGRFSSDERGSDCDTLGAYEALALHSGVDEALIRKLTGSKCPRTISYDDADRLVQVVGEPGMWYDGTLTVVDATSPSLPLSPAALA